LLMIGGQKLIQELAKRVLLILFLYLRRQINKSLLKKKRSKWKKQLEDSEKEGKGL